MPPNNWLNNRTDENTRFFGVEISAVRIGGSTPAPLLRLVVQPNDWGKTVKAKAQVEGAATSGQAYQRFWDEFLEELHRRHLAWTSSRKGLPQNWQTLPSGMSGVAFKCSFGRPGLCSEVYFQDPDARVNDARFSAAEANRANIEATYGAPLSFEPLAGKRGCRIVEYHPGKIGQTEQWSDYIEWFIAAQKRLRTAMSAVVGTNGDSPV